jgi:hypothetical protein
MGKETMDDLTKTPILGFTLVLFNFIFMMLIIHN